MHRLLPPPAVVIIIGALMWGADRLLPLFRFEAALRLPVAFGLLATGVVLMVAAVISFIAARTTINPLRPARASHLITSGVFRLSRNPIYLGDLLLLAAYAVWLGNICNILFLLIFFTYIQRFQIAPEEQALTQLFGENYRAYCASVRRWI